MWRIRLYNMHGTKNKPSGLSLWAAAALLLAAAVLALYLVFLRPRPIRQRRGIPLRAPRPAVQAGSRSADDRDIPLLSEDEKLLYSTVMDQRPIELPVFYYLLKKVRGMRLEDLRSLAAPRITYETYVDNPASARGRVDRVSGTLFRLKRTALPPNNAAGLTHVWEGQIIDRDINTYSFYLTNDPGRFAVKRDVVALYGIFFKIIVYKNRANEPFPSPLLIGKTLVRIDERRRRAGDRFKSAVAHAYRRNPVLVLLLIASCSVFVLSIVLAIRWEARAADARIRRARRLRRQTPAARPDEADL